MGATETIANWIVDTSYEDIPPESVQAAREAYLDCLGLALSGSVQPLGRIITEYVKDQGGTPESTVLGPGTRVPAGSAALANGAFGCAMDLDPGPIMVGMAPALLAVGERIGATGRDLLEAFVVGNELAVALEAVTHTNLQNRGIHAIGGGRISVAAACSKLLDLDARKTAMAMGLATSTEGGLVLQPGHHDQAPARGPHRQGRGHGRADGREGLDGPGPRVRPPQRLVRGQPLGGHRRHGPGGRGAGTPHPHTAHQVTSGGSPAAAPTTACWTASWA